MLRLTLFPDPQLFPLAGVGIIFRSSSNLPRAEPGLDGASPSLLTGMMLILVIECYRGDGLVQTCLLVRQNSPPVCPPPSFPPCNLVPAASKTSRRGFSGRNKHVIVYNPAQPKAVLIRTIPCLECS